MHKKELFNDRDVAQILSQEHTRFSFWVGDPFVDPERALFVGRYIERGPLSLQKFALDDDGLSYFTADGQVQQFDPLECPKCSSQMRIVAFVTDPVPLKQILQSLGLPQFTAPPKLNFRCLADQPVAQVGRAMLLLHFDEICHMMKSK